MVKKNANNIDDIILAARKMKAIGAFIYDTRSEDFDDDGLWFEVVTQASGTILHEAEAIKKMAEEMLYGD